MAENQHAFYIVGVNGFVYHEGRYLVIERGPKEWAPGALCAPGGGMEVLDSDNKAMEDEMAREVLEETGIVIADNPIYGFSKAFKGQGGTPILAVYYLCAYASGEAHSADLDEVASAEWLTYDEIMADPRSEAWMLHDTRMIEQVRLAQAH